MFTFKLTDSVNLDLHALSPDQMADELKRQYNSLRGKGAVVHARVGALPARQYVSMLERGYRVSIERENESYLLVLCPMARRRAWVCAARIPSRAMPRAEFTLTRQIIALPWSISGGNM